MKIYLVGGCVRDELLGKRCKDRDFVVFNCTEEEFFKRFPRAIKVGKKIPVYLVGRDEYTISEHDDIMEDLMDRDLTINAIAKDEKGKLYYHPTALRDLENKTLRAISFENFKKDPLRVHRVARFYAQFPDFSIEENTLLIMKEVGKDSLLMKSISKERVSEEVIKAIKAKKPSNFFSLLIDTKAISFWFEEVCPLDKVKFWKEIMDGFSPLEIEVWMGLCYGFLEGYGDIVLARENLKDMSKRIGLPKRIRKASDVFFTYFYDAKDIFLKPPEVIRDVLYPLDRKKFLIPLFRVIEKITNKEYIKGISILVHSIKNVKLPEEYRGLGPKSGEILRNRQIEEVKKSLKNIT